MTTSTRAWWPYDLPLLMMIVSVPVLTGRAIGMFMNSTSAAVDMRVTLAFFVAYAGYEAAFLGWLNRRAPKPMSFNQVGDFALRIQLQAAVQIVTRAVVVWGLVCLFDALAFASVATSSSLPQEFLWPVLAFLAQLAIVYSISISWWRCLSLRRNGADFSALFDGTSNEKRVAIPGACAVVTMALDKYLERLKSPKTPRFSRMFYHANIAIGSAQVNGRKSHLLTWALLPVRVRITLTATDATSTGLCMRCELRAGIHRLELSPNPAIVLSIMRYLQTNLVEPLTSELALSGAVRKQDELRHQAIESQLRILQAQIEPHFLFNTLANVRHLYRSNVDEGESMMDHLIVYLRSTLEELRSDVSTVGKEMELVQHYLAIMKIRMGDRLSYFFTNSHEVAAAAFPPAMLISLVENAIMHGLNHMPNGKLTIAAAREARQLRVTVLDNGAGFSSVQGSGVGLSNIRQRLEVIYGNRAWLEVGAKASGGFMASIVVPFPFQEGE